MLDTDTKRRIDSARDILVGKVPDPKSQVEQITIALIYKFMDDMDADSEEMGGKRKFFADGFARYGWAKLMRAGLGGHETLNLYAEAITKMPENPGIPLLFRDIFKNAYLPYRDPETLRAFLKIIDEFEYDHSERLGDAFEYLLSVLGSQGDAGQFRTPRHIIDFMVEVTDPKKHETVLDPACGTAGFLISSYKHILAANRINMDKQNGQNKSNKPRESCSSMLISSLTPDEKGRLAQNFKGYDISPDMVRLSLVNLYLHGFADPHIFEYDTLTSQDRWNEYADVILANPPFMSPKGGIKPHKRFSVQSKRSEVLFVAYMAEHLTPSGRAGIIVPEGIIFQSQNAYKKLRKMLVDDYLVAVVSLPAGVFNPYSGVKTSILILDKALARQSDTIGFFKVENDGYGLGAQRRAIDKNDLPQVATALKEFIHMDRQDGQDKKNKSCISCSSMSESLISRGTALIVPKEKIAANGDYNLSGERYRENSQRASQFPHVQLGNIVLGKPQYGSGARKVVFDGKVRYVRITDLTNQGELKTNDPVSPSRIEPENFLEPNDLLIARSGSVGRTYLHHERAGIYQYAGYLIRFRIDPEKALPAYVYYVTQSESWNDWIIGNSKTGTLTNINATQYLKFEFPLPPLEVQKEIVSEIESYQKVIDGACAVIDNYHPHISIHPDWPVVELEEACDIQRGKFSHRPRNEPRFYGGEYPFIQTGDVVRANGDKITFTQTLNEEGLLVSKLFQPPIVVITIAANIGDTAVLDFPSCFPDSVVGLIPKIGTDVRYLEVIMRTKKQNLNDIAPQAAQKNINIKILKTVEISLPPLVTQKAIVAEIEAEQALVNANRDLIARFKKKIQATLARVWEKS